MIVLYKILIFSLPPLSRERGKGGESVIKAKLMLNKTYSLTFQTTKKIEEPQHKNTNG
jgi:hypothetical protein